MLKKIMMLLVIMLIMGSCLFVLGNILGTREVGESNIKEVESFKNIDLDTKGLDVTIVKGDKYQVDYSLSGRESLNEMVVVNDTLHFKTSLKMFFRPTGHHHVTITVKEDLEDVSLHTVSGDIKLDVNANDVNLKTTSGNILVNSKMNSVIAKTTAGDIRLEGSINSSSSAKTTAGDILTTIKADIKYDTVAGKIKIEDGSKFDTSYPTLSLKTTAGNISVK